MGRREQAKNQRIGSDSNSLFIHLEFPGVNVGHAFGTKADDASLLGEFLRPCIWEACIGMPPAFSTCLILHVMHDRGPGLAEGEPGWGLESD